MSRSPPACCLPNPSLVVSHIGRSANVVVVGGGLAGLSAAVEAAAAGATVTILEKWDRLGGNSAKATSGINAWGTQFQRDKGVVDDSAALFEADTLRSGAGGTCDASLVATLSSRSREAVEWLSSPQFGVPLGVVAQLGGHSRPRTHRAPDLPDGTPVPIGFTIMKRMEAAVRANPLITVVTNAEVVDLLTTSNLVPVGSGASLNEETASVTGVVYKTTRPPASPPSSSGTNTTSASSAINAADAAPVEIKADAVVLATGGFSADRSGGLLGEFAPQLNAYPTTNGPFATGDGVKMARRIGAKLVDMDKVQLHPTGFIDPAKPADPTKFLGPEALRGAGGVMLNCRGRRFVDELQLRSTVSKAIIAGGDVYPGSGGSFFAFCVLNNEAKRLFGEGAFGFYWKVRGLFTYAEDIKALAKLICSAKKGNSGSSSSGGSGSNAGSSTDDEREVEEALTETLTAYGASSAAKTPCPLTGKSVYPCALGPEGPFYVAAVTPTIHYTMGGALITPEAEIVALGEGPGGEGPRTIRGLFGAGEVTGGVHGMNRLGGNSLLECVVFGRIAGERAAGILKREARQ